MEEIEGRIQAAPKPREFRLGDDIEINKFHAVLHKFIRNTLKEAKKYFTLKKLQPSISSKNAEDDEMP